MPALQATRPFWSTRDVALLFRWLRPKADGFRSPYSVFAPGSARVVSGTNVETGACTGAPGPAYQMGKVVHSQVASGCLSVRPEPSSSAPVTDCVGSGYRFVLEKDRSRRKGRTGSVLQTLQDA